MNKGFIFLLLLNSVVMYSQDLFMQDGTFTQCSGNFVDSGGSGGDYGNNEFFTMTICPDIPGHAIQLDFSSFFTEPDTDYLQIFDGPDIMAQIIGLYSGGDNPGTTSATGNNPSGCLTLVFESSASTTEFGWSAAISCYEPCQTIISQLDSASPPPNGDGYIRVCPNEEITLTGSATFSIDGTGATYEWDLGDNNTIAGQTATFSYPDPGVYLVNLNVRDTNTSNDPEGCTNNNLINQVVQVGNNPDFTGTGASLAIVCLGESTTLTGMVTPQEFINDCTPPVSGTTFLPDGTGVTYETTVTVTCYGSNQILTDVNQLLNVCLNMEHSFLGDLDIVLVSPIGQTVRLHDRSGDSQNLGIPWATGSIDGNSSNTTPGIGLDYCFVPDDTLPTLVEGTQTNGTFPAGDGPGTYTDSFIPSGNYRPIDSFDNLLGSPLNGNWTIRITDNFILDNGYIFEWGIEFDPSILPPDLSFTPIIVSENWDADPSIVNTSGNSITVQPDTTGTHCYTYRILDDFGCEYTDEVCIEITPNPIANSVPDQLFCDDNNDGLWQFDLIALNTLVLGAQSSGDFQLSYHLSQQDADNSENPLPSPFINSTPYVAEEIFVRIEGAANNSCFDTTSFFIDVYDTPTADAVLDMVQCDNDEDGNDTNGLALFDLNSKSAEILGTLPISDYEVKYYLSQTDADMGLAVTEITSPFQNTSSPQLIVARIENRFRPDCYDTTSFSLIVNSLPDVVPLVELQQCDDDADGITIFNLHEANALISPNYLDESITYHTTFLDAETRENAILSETAYMNTDPSATPDILYVRVENFEGCHRISQLNLMVSTTQIPPDFLLNYEVCDDDQVDGDGSNGIASFNFSDATTQVGNLFPVGQPITVSYYETLNDALAEINPIMDISDHRNDSSPFIQSIFVRVDNDIDNSCLGLGEHIMLEVNPLPEFDLEESYLLCTNSNGTETADPPVLETGLSETDYSFMWSLNDIVIPGSTGSSYAPDQGGNYSVVVTHITTGCQYTESTVVNEGGPPVMSVELTSLAFSDVHVIEATVEGNSTYEFSLDDGPWQESGIFVGVSAGEHIVTARDINGCGNASDSVMIMDYPLFFTPNADGYNDTWNINGIATQPDARIFIYDRYGKLLKQLNPSGDGWDGTFNGHPLPTSDYWFTVEYIEPRDGSLNQFKAHFTLKR
jgi:gliding motility-associated-like protein